MMKLANLEDCTGCGACVKICSKGAIAYGVDAEGFPYPWIQNDQYVNCGLCNKVCPALQMPETHAIREAYAARLRDRDALLDSTSGGLFTALSREIFRRNGIVYGCVFDDAYNAIITKAENEEEMKPMRGSKYVWSSTEDSYAEIKRYLRDGRTVLFTGLPCQAAGLKAFLGKDDPNLYLVTFFAAGPPARWRFGNT